jgi:hypothetical protein
VGLGRTAPNEDDEVIWPVSLRGNPHLLIVGLPGMGKTTCLLNICSQLHRQGVAPMLLPK